MTANSHIRPALYNATVRTETPVNHVFLANMAQLWRLDARLAQRIDDLPHDAALATQPSKSGPVTASVTTLDHRTIYLHSRYDPIREAGDFIANLEKSEAGCVMLCGLGLGYHLKAIHAHFGDETFVVVSEPDLVTIKTAMENTDLAAELGTGRVFLLTGGDPLLRRPAPSEAAPPGATLDKAQLHERLQPHATSLMLGTVLAVPPSARDHHANFHGECRKAVTDFAAFAKMSLVTLVKNAAITCRNIACNLPTYVSTPPADILRRRFAGHPAILVAAGPSLAKNMDQLPAVQDRAVIIAAQTTLRPLSELGVRPHFVTSLDFSEMSKQFFENLEIPEEVVLVAEPKAAWQVIDAFKGTQRAGGRRVVLLDNQFAHKCVGEALAKRTPMEAGATVMHLAYYLAKWLGCDPIIFIGQDLGFGGHVYYTPGVAMHRAWAPELGRFATLEMKELERILRQGSILRRVKDIHDQEIYTDEQMFTYLQQFERDFARSTATIIDATEGGARKAGTTIMPLSEAIERYCRNPLPADKFDYLQTPWHDERRLPQARQILAARRAELDEFLALCRETNKLLTEMKLLIGEPKKFNARVVRVDELRTLVQNHALIFEMVRDVCQLGELQRIAADRRLSETASDRARAERQIERDLAFVGHLLEGCEQLAAILDQAIARFDAAIEASA